MKGHAVPIERLASEFACGSGGGCSLIGKVQLPNNAFSAHDGGDWAEGTVIHELAHVWDYWNYGLFSMNMNNVTKSFKVVCFRQRIATMAITKAARSQFLFMLITIPQKIGRSIRRLTFAPTGYVN